MLLHAVEYPEPLPLMLVDSIVWLQPAQLKLTLVVQYQQSSVNTSSLSTIVQSNIFSILVLVFVLVPLEHSEYGPYSVYVVETQHDGVT